MDERDQGFVRLFPENYGPTERRGEGDDENADEQQEDDQPDARDEA